MAIGGSPSIPERMNLKTMARFAPNVLPHPRWLWSFAKTGRIPDLTAPNLTPPGGQAPTFFEAYYEWIQPLRPPGKTSPGFAMSGAGLSC